jgi:hypothetical protein
VLEKFSDPRGSLTPIEGERHVPFPVRRIFYFYDIPVGESRGAHAHRIQEQVIICLAGSFDVLLDDGERRQLVRVSRPWNGLYVPAMLWASQVSFDGGTVGLVVASDVFDEADYIRSYDEFLSLIRSR